MNNFGTNDVIFARATMMGHELVNARYSDIPSMEALLRRIKSEMGAAFGLVTITIRNLTQGWTQQRAYRVA
ncbi:MAG: hypothetical protein LUD17_12180 [Bacteroidales bacterium]|nr:hypothetical protein [Bacteroidales bacterium]